MKIVNESEFKNHQKGLTVALFTSEHCFPCGCMKRSINKVEESLKQKQLMEFVNVNSDTEEKLCEQYKIDNIPTMIIFKDGEEVFRSEGAKDSKKIKYSIVETLQKLNINF